MTLIQIKTKKILVVEDEPGISDLCELALTDIGFEVDTAENGKVALNILSKKEHDLYLLDIRTPIMDGIEFYQHLENKFPRLVNRVVFTTGDLMNVNVMSFITKTNRPLLPKPFTLDELKTILSNAQTCAPLRNKIG